MADGNSKSDEAGGGPSRLADQETAPREDSDSRDWDSGDWESDTIKVRPGAVGDGSDETEESQIAGDSTPVHGSAATPDPVESMRGEQVRKPSLLILTGRRTGEMIRLDDTRVTLGRHRDEVDVWFEDATVSRRHAVLERTSKGSYRIRDLNSSNGTFVNQCRVRGWRKLHDGEKIVLSKSAVLKYTVPDSVEADFHERMYESAVRDGLTRAYSRAFLEEQMKSDMALNDRRDAEYQTALLLMDIDHFKRVNDEYGHAAGDEVLRSFAERVEGLIRSGDVFARYGGEEFALLLRDTDPEAVGELGERIRQDVASQRFEFKGGNAQITISIGAALYDPQLIDSVDAWIRRADSALYRAKEEGRNQVCLAD